MATPDMALLPKRSLVRPLVQDGVVVTPVRIRNVPISSSSLTQGTTTRTMPVQEIVLAVDPEEVAPLAEAMDLKYEITCVARRAGPRPLPSPAARTVGGRSVPGSCGARQGRFGWGQRGQPGQGCVGAWKSENRQPHED